MTYLIASDIPNDNGYVVVDDDGEIVDSAHIDDRLAFLARQHHYLKDLQVAIKAKLGSIDAVLLKQQGPDRVSYSDLVGARRDRASVTTDVAGFKAELESTELTAEEARELVMAASAFDRKAVPVWIRAVYENYVTEGRTKPWYETALAIREPKPVSPWGGTELRA